MQASNQILILTRQQLPIKKIKKQCHVQNNHIYSTFVHSQQTTKHQILTVRKSQQNKACELWNSALWNNMLCNRLWSHLFHCRTRVCLQQWFNLHIYCRWHSAITKDHKKRETFNITSCNTTNSVRHNTATPLVFTARNLSHNQKLVACYIYYNS